MYIQIAYKSGENRRINISPLFFTDDKMNKVSTSQKCLTLAADMGGAVHHMVCFKNEVKMFEVTNPGNEVVTPELHVINDLERTERKKLRRLHKNERFTQSFNYTTQVFTNLLNRSNQVAGPIAEAA